MSKAYKIKEFTDDTVKIESNGKVYEFPSEKILFRIPGDKRVDECIEMSEYLKLLEEESTNE